MSAWALTFDTDYFTVSLPSFILPLHPPAPVAELSGLRLERAIGVLYKPETERASHYFFCSLANQFDAVIHFQETQAVEPLEKTAKWVAGEDRVQDTMD